MVRKAERASATRWHAFRAADSINSSDNSKLLYEAGPKGRSDGGRCGCADGRAEGGKADIVGWSDGAILGLDLAMCHADNYAVLHFLDGH
jgi:hypothetical protein